MLTFGQILLGLLYVVPCIMIALIVYWSIIDTGEAIDDEFKNNYEEEDRLAKHLCKDN